MTRALWVGVGLLVLVVGVVDLFVYWTAVPVFEDNRAGFERLAHLRTLLLHLVACGLTGWIGYRVTGSDRVGATAGVLLLVHPLAVPALGYAQAIREMEVACGALGVGCLVIEEGMAYVILGILGTLLVIQIKASALGVLGIVPLVYALRHPRRRGIAGVVVVGLALGVVTQSAVAVQYIPRGTVGQMGTQAVAVVRLLIQSIVPLNIAFQDDAWRYGRAAKVAGLVVLFVLVPAVAWRYRTVRPLLSLGLGWALLLVLPRILIPTTHVESGVLRGPELIYAHQWYPALPGMVWVFVAAVRHPSKGRTV